MCNDLACSTSPEQHKWVLVLSNLSYLLPAGVVGYKMFKPNGRQMSKQNGTELIALFGFLTFFGSWSYHSCRADLSISSGIDINEIDPNPAKLPPCDICPDNTMTWINDTPGASSEKMTYEIARFIDYFVATFTLLMVIIHVVPISEKARKLIVILSMIWMIMFLSGGNETIALLPSLMSVIVLIIFWFRIRNHKEKGFYTRNKVWTSALICFILAVSFLKWNNEPYWLMHSLWHIFGAIGAALLLSRTVGCYQDINENQIDIPKWMQSVFNTPNSCKKYDMNSHKKL